MKYNPIDWSDLAISNLCEIYDYIAQDSSLRASQWARKVIGSVNRLKQFPESGRRVPELMDQTPLPREILVGEYRVLYRIVSGAIEIVTIIHGKRILSLTKLQQR